MESMGCLPDITDHTTYNSQAAILFKSYTLSHLIFMIVLSIRLKWKHNTWKWCRKLKTLDKDVEIRTIYVEFNVENQLLL
jgi:hypothetical protein